jgi:hydrogenase-1 operon protein HyaF
MGLKGIPIVSFGPGSQPPEDDGANLDYLDMPEGMAVYQKPLLPEPDEIKNLSDVLESIDWLQDALEQYRPGEQSKLIDISALDTENRDLVNQILGEGEVSVKYQGVFQARVQESVLAGVWRTIYLDNNGAPTRDLLEVGEVPILARLADGRDATSAVELLAAQPPEQAMNSGPILTEIKDRVNGFQAGKQAHVINLTLLPMSSDDVQFLDKTLGVGPVRILSRGYGHCRITSTLVPNVWWVRYYNSTGTLILNTLEVVDMPAVVRAASQDFEDSRQRLAEMLEPYR